MISDDSSLRPRAANLVPLSPLDFLDVQAKRIVRF